MRVIIMCVGVVQSSASTCLRPRHTFLDFLSTLFRFLKFCIFLFTYARVDKTIRISKRKNTATVCRLLVVPCSRMRNALAWQKIRVSMTVIWDGRHLSASDLSELDGTEINEMIAYVKPICIIQPHRVDFPSPYSLLWLSLWFSPSRTATFTIQSALFSDC